MLASKTIPGTKAHMEERRYESLLMGLNDTDHTQSPGSSAPTDIDIAVPKQGGVVCIGLGKSGNISPRRLQKALSNGLY